MKGLTALLMMTAAVPMPEDPVVLIPGSTYEFLSRPWTERDNKRWWKRFRRRQRRARRDRRGW